MASRSFVGWASEPDMNDDDEIGAVSRTASR